MRRWIRVAALLAVLASVAHAGCAESHDTLGDAGVDAHSLSDMGAMGRPDAHVDASRDAATLRDQAAVLLDIAVDPSWDVDVDAWLDAGGCGAIAVPHQPDGPPYLLELLPGTEMPWTSGANFCNVTVDLAVSALVESNAAGRCTTDADAGTARCDLQWSSPLTVVDYLWLCRIDGLPPVEGISCFEWGE